MREADKIKKLDGIAYFAHEEQMGKLMRGEFSPKKVERFEVARNFIDDFMCIREDEIEKNKRFWDEEFIFVQEIIAANIKDYDRINQEYDSKLIKKNLGEDSQDKEEESNDIDSFDASTPFFSYRFGKAFPGVRGIKEFSNPNATIKIGTMFSGIGAIEYALKRLNLKSEILFASDIDNFAKQSYFANYEIAESNWYNDVHDIDGKKYKGKLSNGEIGLPMTGSNLILPCGIFGKWEK